jgi:cell fate regulator YaaT (PSP1 superfamily)
VVWAAEYSAEDTEGFPVLVGLADEADLAATEELRKTKAKALVASRKLIREHGLPMKVLAVDPQTAAGKIVIYYSSPETVDFRSLLRDLSATLASRIELRQLASRDAVRVTGAIGSCGRDTCCSTFLKDYEPITLAMARDQDLPANPMRISGACGRLMCCLKYEHPLYDEFLQTTPGVGDRVETPEGDGRVVGHDVPRDQVVVRLDAGGRRTACDRADVCSARAEYRTRTPDQQQLPRVIPTTPPLVLE